MARRPQLLAYTTTMRNFLELLDVAEPRWLGSPGFGACGLIGILLTGAHHLPCRLHSLPLQAPVGRMVAQSYRGSVFRR